MTPSILVIDDEKNIRLLLSKCLSSEGYSVSTAEDGLHGIESFEKNKYDAVLLDMKMPGLNGMDVLQRLKEINESIPVIMMTAFGTIESAVCAMKLGAVDFIRKPFTPDVIRSEVKSVLERMQLQPSNVEDYASCLQYAKKCIIIKDFEEAKKYLMKSLSYDTDKPEIYNLLGVLREYKGDIHDAQKYYRMALCIDYTYEPANKNLERTAQFMYTSKGIQLGDISESGSDNSDIKDNL